MKRADTDGDSQYAQELIERFGAQMLATARRYSSTAEDAEDAYQRAAEIALRHRPGGDRDALLRWLRTTTKHEALAIRRHRSRVVAVGAPESLPEPQHAADTHQRAERLEQLRQGGEALRRLKPQEIRALQLRAEGYSYKEICQLTGWTYTKVNRCVTEGRRAFLEGLGQIESGAECDRLAPQLSALADGEATAADRAALRPHLATCLACRARLRESRAAPARVAALAPLTLGAGTEPGGHPLRSLWESIAGVAHDRWTALTAAAQERVVAAGERLHQTTELATAQKAAAVASAVALSGGGGDATRPAARGPAPASVVQRSVASEPAQPPPSATDAPAADGLDSPAPAATIGPASADVPREFGPELAPPTPTPRADEPGTADHAPGTPAPTPTPAAATGEPEPGAFER